ncbi:S49 family peptidase [Sphingopyxis sp. GW247-27LB]|uniref:S49 family peptidase n=1 Tax=Sphingopyxis sp. GW247-27LB TaxID=2012632 RepID=UPI000BA75DD2|nr:S49 family peptidase [Sphingopyxis sp. GW247-27LB]PAL23530.1 peptidase S49 [Sphingopyxis sp. GW247-27LB]
MNPLLTRFANEPALINPEMLGLVQGNLVEAAKIDLSRAVDLASDDDDFWPQPDSWAARYRPYVVKDGTLQIPVKGVLLHDFGWQLDSWATGYDYILRAFKRGMEDGNVQRIAFIVHSPGGTVAGCFETLEKMQAAKAEAGKPVEAFVAEAGYSAAYATMMVADKITVTRTGGVGSIGVVTMHIDQSKLMDEWGLKITFIFAGKHKVDGNSFEALPDDVRERIQARIDDLYQIFVSAVAEGRSMDEQTVRKTEAQCFTAPEAISNGLADNVGWLDDALAAFVADLSNPSNDEGDDDMSNKTDNSAPEASAENTQPALSQADIDAAVKADRARIGAITGCEDAEGRGALANHIAMNTDMDLDAAKAMLAAAPKETAAAPSGSQTPFDAAMDGNSPDVAAEPDNADPKAEDDGSDTIALARRFGLACVSAAAA